MYLLQPFFCQQNKLTKGDFNKNNIFTPTLVALQTSILILAIILSLPDIYTNINL